MAPTFIAQFAGALSLPWPNTPIFKPLNPSDRETQSAANYTNPVDRSYVGVPIFCPRALKNSTNLKVLPLIDSWLDYL